MGSQYTYDSIVSLWDAQASERPDKAAIVKGNHILTYGDLNQRADAVAGKLREIGIVPEQPVVILAEHSLEFIIGLCAILKAGGCYVPLDPSWPKSRITFLIRDCKPCAVLQTGSLSISSDGLPLLDLRDTDSFTNTSSPSMPAVSPCQLAYIMYTSGTSGQPKGTLIEHKSVVRLVRHPNYVELSPDTSMLQTGSLTFDAATFEIWGCLLNGGTLYFPQEDVLTDPQLLGRELQHYQINTLWLTTALFHYLTDCDPAVFHGIKFLLTGGELISEKHVRRFQEANRDTVLINCYGPTENTTFTTFYQIPPDYTEVSIGKPISGTDVLLMVENRICSEGETGEICITGDGLARGYLNLPALTAEHFCTAPLGEGRMYRSGDFAKMLPDGNLQFVGRKDDQIKIRGYRVEPEEIRQVLCRMDSIRDAAVTVSQNRRGEKYLCACYIADRIMSNEEIVEYLSGELPSYMLPTFYAPIERMPLTANGKIDRSALPGAASETSEISCFPCDPTEQLLLSVFREVLENNSFGTKDDFFRSGGQSISAAIAISRIKEEFGIKLPLRDLYLCPNVEKLAVLIAGRQEVPDTVRPEILPDTPAAYTEEELRQMLIGQEDSYREGIASGQLTKTVPLSPIQEISMQSGIKVSGMEMDFMEEPDRKRLDKVWTRIRNEYDVLRCFFRINEKERGMAVYEVNSIAAIPYLNLSGCNDTVRNNLLTELKERRNRYYEDFSYAGSTAAHGIVLVKLADRHYRLYFYCTHLIFDGYSADLLEGKIRELYRLSGDIAVKPETVHAYEAYTGQVLSSSPGITEDALIRQIGLDAFAGSLPAYKDFSDREDMECFCYSFERKQEDDIPRHKLVAMVENAYDKALRCAFGDVKVPFFVIINGREYSAFQFYDEIGELIDCMPFVFDAEHPEPVFASMAAQLERMKRYNINYVGLMVSPALQQSYPSIARLLMTVGMSGVNIPIFNYLVMYEDIAPDHDENTPELQDGTAMHVSSIGYAGNRVDLYLLCPKSRIAAVRKLLDECFLSKPENALSKPAD